MASQKIDSDYFPTIGIECHVQLKTVTKLFSGVGNDAREAPPNTLVSHICFGLPGSLPVLNKEAITLATRAAVALGTKPQKFSQFDRKHYFYPDLPKGYQITQFTHPIIADGSITIVLDDEQKTIGITRAHLEEDAGKNTHPSGKDYSLVDLNRAGTPLLEIVSEPDMHSAAEAKAYARELHLRMKYAQVSDANLYYGNMRFDVNVSVSKDHSTLGTRSETKNLNSFRNVERAVEYEIKRQTALLESGGTVVQETLGWDDAKGKTISQRSKEEAHDYRYFPEPDIPPITISDDFVSRIQASVAAMPDEWRKRLSSLGLDSFQIELLLDSEVDEDSPGYLSLIEDNLGDQQFVKMMVNWIINVEIPERRSSKQLSAGTNKERADYYRQVYELYSDSQLSSSRAKELIKLIINLKSYIGLNVKQLAEKNLFIQVSDETEIAEIVKKVLSDNPQAANDVAAGELKAIGFLVGQVMKLSKGKANPSLAQKLIRSQLGV